MRCYLLVLLLVPCLVSAEIYRYVDEHGNVSYSEKPVPGAERIKLPQPSSYQPPARLAPEPQATKPAAEATSHKLTVLKPGAGAVIRSDSGRVEVALSVSPDPAAAGLGLRYRLDDKPPATGAVGGFVLEGVARGEHMLSVWLVNAAGQTVGQKQTISFRVLRGADLFRPLQDSQGEGAGVEQAPRAPMAPRAPRPDLPRQYEPQPRPLPPSPPAD